MRYIPLKDHTPDQDWVQKAEVLLQHLKDAPNKEARKKLIDGNRQVWGELKEWLLTLSHQKCWFSEAKDCFSHWEVEHYRPKTSAKDLDGTEHDAYWWLAFDWRNFRICGNAGNRKKGTFFPLRDGCPRATQPTDDLRTEDPILLDPTDEDDPNLLTFDFEGHVRPAAELPDGWDKRRAEYSILRYNLDFGPLMDKRKAIWNDCWNRIQEYKHELQTYEQSNNRNLIAKANLKRSAKLVRELMKETKELSAVARACVLSTGDPRVTRLLQSA
jgi:uncharacterized protein (TIGR02646 family)